MKSTKKNIQNGSSNFLSRLTQSSKLDLSKFKTNGHQTADEWQTASRNHANDVDISNIELLEKLQNYFYCYNNIKQMVRRLVLRTSKTNKQPTRLNKVYTYLNTTFPSKFIKILQAYDTVDSNSKKKIYTEIELIQTKMEVQICVKHTHFDITTKQCTLKLDKIIDAITRTSIQLIDNVYKNHIVHSLTTNYNNSNSNHSNNNVIKVNDKKTINTFNFKKNINEIWNEKSDAFKMFGETLNTYKQIFERLDNNQNNKIDTAFAQNKLNTIKLSTNLNKALLNNKKEQSKMDKEFNALLTTITSGSKLKKKQPKSKKKKQQKKNKQSKSKKNKQSKSKKK